MSEETPNQGNSQQPTNNPRQQYQQQQYQQQQYPPNQYQQQQYQQYPPNQYQQRQPYPPNQYQNRNPYQTPYSGKIPGRGQAIGSVVVGIIAIIFWFFGAFTFVLPILSVILGIVGIVLASMAKKQGLQGGLQTAGMVLSIIGLIGGAIFAVACSVCTAAILGSMDYY